MIYKYCLLALKVLHHLDEHEAKKASLKAELTFGSPKLEPKK